MEARLAEQKELEAAHIRQQQREEEWPKKKLEMGKDAERKIAILLTHQQHSQ